jgi:UDP-N-acetylmuramoyl-tripeptide--D-alanyl-D-alanine ligase
MPDFSPALLTTWTGGRWTAPPAGPLAGLAHDTRTLRPGEMFVALQTEKRDGHDYLAAAEAAGAKAALVARAEPASRLPQLVVADPLAALQAVAREHRKTFLGPVIGVTGSCGKTSTKNLLALLLGGQTDEAAGKEGTGRGGLATAGNWNNHLGVPLTLTRLDPARHGWAVIEAGVGGPREMGPLAAMIAPEIALVTTIAPAHLGAFGTLEAVAEEKAALAAALRPGGTAILAKECTHYAAFRNLRADQWVLERAEELRPAPPPTHTVPFNVRQRPTETVITIAYGPTPPQTFTMRRVTDGMAQNAALALTTAWRLGTPVGTLAERLAAWTPAPLRGEIRQEAGRLLYLDCYNANPASMADALATFTAVAPATAPRLYILGGMEELGADAAALHRQLGRRLRLREGDRVVVLGDQAQEVCAGVADQGGGTGAVTVAASTEEVAGDFAGWRGAIFLKGSRRYRLETLLAAAPEPALAAAH